MKVGKRKALAALSALATSAIAVAAWYLGGTDALLAVVLAAVVIGAGLAINVVVQAERRLRLAIDPSIRDFAQRTRAEAKQDFSESVTRMGEALAAGIDNKVNELDRRLQRPGEQAEAMLRAINAGHRRIQSEQEWRLRTLDRSIGRVERTMRRLFRHSPAEVDALLQVHRRSEMADPLPLMGGWALSPRGLLQTIDLVIGDGVSLVVECGSGTSTLFLARALQLKGSGRLIALEHLEEYLELTEQGLKQQGLSEIAEVRHAPLANVDVGGKNYDWYSTTTIADLHDIDVLIVDGPPAATGDWARYPAYPLLRDKLSPGATIVIDDAERADEKSIVGAWLELGGLSQIPSYSNDQAIFRSAIDE